MTRQQRQARGRPNAQEILQRRAAARLVHGNTQRQWNNKWYTWWTTQQSTTRKPRNECCCSKCQGQYSTTYGRIRSNVWSRSNSSLQEHWKGIQRRLPGYGGEVAEFEHRTHQAATTGDADGNTLGHFRALKRDSFCKWYDMARLDTSSQSLAPVSFDKPVVGQHITWRRTLNSTYKKEGEDWVGRQNDRTMRVETIKTSPAQ